LDGLVTDVDDFVGGGCCVVTGVVFDGGIEDDFDSGIFVVETTVDGILLFVFLGFDPFTGL